MSGFLIFVLFLYTWISLRNVRQQQADILRRLNIIERKRYDESVAAPEQVAEEPVPEPSPYFNNPAYPAAVYVTPVEVAADLPPEDMAVSLDEVPEAPAENISSDIPYEPVEAVGEYKLDPVILPAVEEEVTLSSAIETEIEGKEQSHTSLEQRIGARWLVWLGGLSLILGGGYFVAYSIDQGWLSIGLRLTISALFGLGLMAVGEKLRLGPRFVDTKGKVVSLPQSVSAGGAGILFASIYSAYYLFNLIPQSLAFTALAATCLLTLAISLRQGMIMAVIGLVGAYSVPALISDGHGSFTSLIAYLLALSVISEVLDRRRGWALLHTISLIANLIYCLVPLVGATSIEQYYAMSYLLALAALYSSRLERNKLSIGLLLALIVQKLSLLTPFNTSAYLIAISAFLLPLMVGAYKRSNTGVLIAGLFGFALTMVTSQPGVFELNTMTLLPIGFVALLLLDCARKCAQDDNEIQIAALLPIAILIALWGCMSGFAVGDSWAMLFGGFALVTGGLHFYTASLANAEKPVPSIMIAHSAAGILIAIMTHFAGTELATVLAVYVPVAAWLCRRTPLLINPLALVAAYAMFRTLLLQNIFNYPLQSDMAPLWIMQSFAIPLAAYVLTSYLLRSRKQFGNTRSVIECGALLYAVLLPYAVVRTMLGAPTLISMPFSFAEASMLGTLWLVLAVGGMRVETIRNSLVGKAGCYLLAYGASFTLVMGPLFAFNPLITNEPTGFITLLLAYGVPAVLYLVALRPLNQLARPQVANAAAVIGLAFSMMLILLEVLHFTRGDVLWGTFNLYESTLVGLIWAIMGGSVLLSLSMKQRLTANPQIMWMANFCGGTGVAVLAVFNLLVLNPLFHHSLVGAMPLFNWLLPAYAVPAVLLAGAAWMLHKANKTDQSTIMGLGSLVFGMTYISLEVLHTMRGDGFVGQFDFHEATLIGLIWTAIGGLAGTRDFVIKTPIAKQAFAVLTAAGLFVLTVLPMFVFNPLWNHISVGTLPVFNWLLLAYGLPTMLLGYVVRDQAQRGQANHILATGSAVLTLIYLFTWLSLEVRHTYHGEFLTGYGSTQLEWYTYSAVWLLSGFTLLAVGVWRQSKLLRQAALATILLTVAKVFLSDMGQLQGLLRAVSFLGLGVALMGVGYLYQRFVISPIAAKK